MASASIPRMASFTVRVGVLLVILGVASYVMTGATSLTALIPSVVGAALALCGVLASRSRVPRPVALRVAIVIAGVGLMGTVSRARHDWASPMATGAPRRPRSSRARAWR